MLQTLIGCCQNAVLSSPSTADSERRNAVGCWPSTFWMEQHILEVAERQATNSNRIPAALTSNFHTSAHRTVQEQPFESQQTFRRNMSPSSPGSKNNQTRNQLWLSLAFMLVSCLAYSSILNMEAICSSETPVGFQRTALRYTPENRTHSGRSENPKFYKNTILQAGRSPVRFPIRSLYFLIDLILRAALWS
jgi:hypothetical protein